MMPMIRTKQPQFLKDNKKAWTKSYIDSGKWNTSWHKRQEELLKALNIQTKYHCAFCDDVLNPYGSDNGEIEHFKPKESYKDLAYDWKNLYPICRSCNSSKGKRYSILLLRPDNRYNDFSDWFWLDTSSFKLKPIKINSNWQRAFETIKLYGLNKSKKIERRKFEYVRIKNNFYINVDYQPFRFIKSS